VASLIANVEGQKKEAITVAEAELSAIEAEKATAAAEAGAKKAISTAEQGTCEAKGTVVEAAREVSNTAKAVFGAAQKEEAAFNKKQAELLAEQETFQKQLAEIFVPLKEGTLQGSWQNRNKKVAELQKVLKQIGTQDSLVEAFATTMKMTPEKREGTFAKATMNFVEDVFSKHTAELAKAIAGLDAEGGNVKAALANAEAALNDKKAALEVVEKEFDAMQDIWVGFDKETAVAERALKQIEAKIPRVQKSIDKVKADLEKFLEVPALFAHLKEHSTVAPVEEEPMEEEEVAEPDAVAEADAAVAGEE